MRKNCLVSFAFLVFVLKYLATPVFAETKMPSTPDAPGGIIPKIYESPDGPELTQGGVYPMWGPVCQRYTYYTVYRDKNGRAPEYVRLYFNGRWIDASKENPNDNDYKKGVKYIYKFVPNKIGANFFFFEASNGLGKRRQGIIDSPGNGPVLFESDFSKNEIAVIDAKTGKKILTYSAGKDWVNGVALSKDGKYLAAVTSGKILLFDTANPRKPLWEYNSNLSRGVIGGDVNGGIAISDDGSRIACAFGSSVFLFDKKSNKPIWQAETGNAYAVSISADGKYIGVGTAGEEKNEQTNLLILFSEKNNKRLWQYHASGNFHDVSLTEHGDFVAGATGCPDRRAYIFGKDSNKPLLRSEMLTYDSPVARSKISLDGKYAAFTTEGGPDSSVVVKFSKDSNKPLWKYEDSDKRAARGFGMTPDSKYVAAATMNGRAYLLDNAGKLVKDWYFEDSSTGALDISDDGKLIAVGGTDNKVHLLASDGSDEKAVDFNEFVAEIDVSSDGRYVAAGTGGSIYFFEGYKSPRKDEVFTCDKVTEPEPMEKTMGGPALNYGEGSGSSSAFDGSPVPGGKKLPWMVFGFLFAGSVLGLAGYVGGIWVLRRKGKKIFVSKRVVVIVSVLAITFALATFICVLGNRGLLGGKKEESGDKIIKGAPEGVESGVCGNTFCEPSLGESKENCPKDCSGEGD